MEQLKTKQSTAIDSAIAEQWAKNWLEFITPLNEEGNSAQPNFVSSFRVPLNNLITLYHERNITTIRLYLAREDGAGSDTYGACKPVWVPLDARNKELRKINYQSMFFCNDQSVPADQANRWIQNWQNFIAPYNEGSQPNQPNLVYSFRLNMEDFISLHEEKGISSVYMFLGKTESGACKLFWVPLDEKDQVFLSEIGQITAFDFSTACPPYCD